MSARVCSGPPSPKHITHFEVPLLYESDATIYPSPLKLDTFRSWLTAAPAFSFRYPVPNDELGGVVVALPLKERAWNKLTHGLLKEWELRPIHFARPHTNVCLHIWHIEKCPGWSPEWGRFGDVALEAVKQVATRKGMTIHGWSGLAVTDDGKRMCERIGWREGVYQGQVVTNDSQIHELKDWAEDVWEADQVVNRCRMFYRRGEAWHSSRYDVCIPSCAMDPTRPHSPGDSSDWFCPIF